MGQYEQHFFQDGNLPVLFHLDWVSQKKNEIYPHWHENIELLYCIQGQGEAVIDSKMVPLCEGRLTVVNSSRLHYTRSLTEKVGYYCLIVDSKLLERFDLDAEQQEFAQFVESDEVKERFERIIKEMEQQQPLFETMVKGELLGLMAYLFRHFSVPGRQKGKSGMVKQGIQYLKKHYKEPLEIESVAQAAGFSQYYFCRSFKSMTGYTVNEYLRFLRCQEAMQMLRETDETVSQIASECGFDDVSYFTKVFKKQTGRLPSQIRKEKRNEAGILQSEH